MNKHVIITISRQFGSNGREIGRQLAEYLDIGYYNKEIMELIANDFGINPDFFREENRNEQGLFSVAGRHKISAITELSINSEVYEKACELIQGISQRESAVIVGRCADYILKDHPNTIKLFIYSDLETRINWSISEYKVPARKARKFVHDKDERRAGFYEFYTGQKWGASSNYDMMINTSYMNREEIVKMLAKLYDIKIGTTSIKGAYMNQYLDHKDITITEVE
ncbi:MULTISPECIES: AAA family ATPase [Faecalicoccus]|uniref:Cytidylate kinase-like family protein n=1 Tax=Faecalicoccus pleomorphus TaxID=1323 RepID=A0AAW6CWC9_9FIRM|nr:MULTISPECIES: cytidylate kinase-like family protein [Faecalicoccus]MCI6378919.1 cytidylate kinase-like family protein [Erysipelotrichaceae bacterium]MDB7980951.1 cytidylate kinase-like family protein [Faecalicoccus pleomorphus]MDB7983246.1 cytidylate kinase-like family protein [Faecalicoccus pleomorphus]MDY4869284.1 cytidylate kinase-like family protein [Faecalicoccus sp.]